MAPGFELPLPFEAAGFRVLRKLGAGAMGAVYEAEDLAARRRVALKVLPEGQLRSSESRERFEREARLAAGISHPSCVFVFGVHEVHGLPAISMELLPDTTLSDALKQASPPPIERAVVWILQVIDGLEAAHRAGVLHRDVKPGNCFFTADERVKVGDFGLARSSGDEQSLTQPGMFIGTPLYASPEQVRGKQLDLRSDLYSVGATLYALIAGVPAFKGGDATATLVRILTEEPPDPRSVRPEIPTELSAVVLRCMAKAPDERFASYAELRRALAPFVDGAAAAGALSSTSSTLPTHRLREATGELGRYQVLSVVSATSHGKLLRARDGRLEREVWLHLFSPVLPASKRPDVSPPEGRAAAYRPRLISSERESRSPFDVYEQIAGAGLRAALQSGTFAVWANAHALLTELADFLTLDPRPRHLEQLWIESGGRLRVLDFAVGSSPEAALEPRALLARLARELNAGTGPSGAGDPARALLRELAQESGSIPDVARAAERLADPRVAPHELGGTQRLLQSSVAGLPLAALAALGWTGALPQGVSPAALAAALIALSTLAAAALQGALSLRLFGMTLADADGRPASRGRAALRALLAQLPLGGAAAGVELLRPLDALAWFALLALALLAAAHAASVLQSPSRGTFERVTGTRVARR